MCVLHKIEVTQGPNRLWALRVSSKTKTRVYDLKRTCPIRAPNILGAEVTPMVVQDDEDEKSLAYMKVPMIYTRDY